MSILLDQYATTNKDTDRLFVSGVSGGKDAYGQALILTRRCSIVEVRFFLSKYATPTGTLIARVYACTGTPGTDGKPTGVALGSSAVIDIANITATATLWPFLFASPVPADVGAICIACEIVTKSGFSNDAYVKIGSDASSPSHTTGNLFSAATIGTWSAENTQDLCFEAYGNTKGQILTIL